MEIIKVLEWSMSLPEIVEARNYVCPISANKMIEETEMNGYDYCKWQMTIGAAEPLEKMYVNIIGAVFLGKCSDFNLGWQAYQEFDGPEAIINEDVGVTDFWSSLLDLPNDFANKLLELHSNPFSKNTYSIHTIVEYLKLDRLADLSH